MYHIIFISSHSILYLLAQHCCSSPRLGVSAFAHTAAIATFMSLSHDESSMFIPGHAAKSSSPASCGEDSNMSEGRI